MKRSTDMGLLIFGIVLSVVGAIMRYAVEVTTEGFNIHTAGVIMLIVGILAALVGLILVFMGRTSHSVMTARTLDTPTGQMHVEERKDSLPPG